MGANPLSGSVFETLANYNPAATFARTQAMQAEAAEARARAAALPQQVQAQTQIAQQQAQALQLENQQRQVQIQDAEALKGIYANTANQGDPDAMVKDAAGKLSGVGFQNFLGQQLELQKMRLANSEAQNKVQAANYDRAGDIVDGLRTMYQKDPASATQAYAAQAAIVHQLAPNAPLPQQYDDDALGFASNWLGHASKTLGQQKTQAEITETQTKTAGALRSQAAQDLGNVNDQGSYNLWRSKYGSAVGNTPVQFDSAQVAQLRENLGVPLQEQPKFELDRAKLRMGVFGDNEFDMFLAKNAGQFKNADGTPKTAAQLTAPEFNSVMGSYAQAKQDPVMRQMAIDQKQLSEAMLRMQVSNNPTPEDIHMLAQNMVNHTMAPSQFSEIKSRGTAGGIGLKIVTEAQRIDPNFSMERADAEYKAMQGTENKFANGPEATLVRSNNNALEHLGLLDQARQAMANGNVQVVNSVANALGAQLGHDPKTTFDAIAARVGDEVSKAFIANGGGEVERLAAANTFNSKMSDDQIRSNIAATVGLMDSPQKNLQEQYRRGTYGQGAQAENLFTPGARAARDRVLQNAQGTTGGTLAQVPARPTNVPAGAKYSPSQKSWWWQGGDGKWQHS